MQEIWPTLSIEWNTDRLPNMWSWCERLEWPPFWLISWLLWACFWFRILWIWFRFRFWMDCFCIVLSQRSEVSWHTNHDLYRTVKFISILFHRQRFLWSHHALVYRTMRLSSYSFLASCQTHSNSFVHAGSSISVDCSLCAWFRSLSISSDDLSCDHIHSHSDKRMDFADHLWSIRIGCTWSLSLINFFCYEIDALCIRFWFIFCSKELQINRFFYVFTQCTKLFFLF